MKLSWMSLLGVCTVSLLCFLNPSTTHAFEIQIDVAPNVLNLQSESVIVTVHTDIAYSLVVGSTVFLNGVEINYWKLDDRGNFVAKFLSNEIKTIDGLITNDYNTMVFAGYTTDGEAFIGVQDIKVIDVIPQGKE